METKSLILEILEPLLEESGLVLVELQTPAEHRFQIFVDGKENVSIDICTRIARRLRDAGGEALDPFEIMVSSPGLDKPFRHPVQFDKNVGKNVEIFLNDGRKLIGRLASWNEEALELNIQIPGKHKGAKPTYAAETTTLPQSEIKHTSKHISF
jgi:ribosome maturation factor RimP